MKSSLREADILYNNYTFGMNVSDSMTVDITKTQVASRDEYVLTNSFNEILAIIATVTITLVK